MKMNNLASLLMALALITPAYAAAPGQDSFATPKEAVQAVLQACKTDDNGALLKIFGPDGKDIVVSGDPSDDKDSRAMFAAAAGKKYKLISDPMNKDKMILSIGKEDWPFPIPLMRVDGRWFFDSAAGRQEILARRIGSNEMNAIEVSHGYVEAQFEYAQSHRKDGVPEYAQKIVSSTGKQNGLYWESVKGAPECDVPKGFADAAAGMSMEKREPYRGYYFRILTAQGPDARGGALNYVVNSSMIGGFALVAWPAEYGVSGVQTFIVDHDGTVYEKNLGPETVRIAAEMTEFNPDKSWQPVSGEATSPK
jgi:hypothetical protein